MQAHIANLTELMKLKRQTKGPPFVLMLGAGASMSSGVKSTATIMQELVERYGQGIPGESLADRFDTLWRETNPDTRKRFLEPYLDREPSSGYLRLAEAIRAGYFSLAITLNYDDLLRKALHAVGFLDFQEVIRSRDSGDEARIVRLVESPQRKFTILKLHGSLAADDTFLFDRSEMRIYPDAIATLVARLTARDLIVCGYAFKDHCMTRAFSPEGELIYWVNPSGAPDSVKPILDHRKSKHRVVSGEAGSFDAFCQELAAGLFASGSATTARRINPFKFLDSFDVEEREWFFGREALTATVVERLEQRPGSLHLLGPTKAGKTSLVRAGVFAALPPERYQRVYLRCRPDLEVQLREQLGRQLQREIPEALEPGRACEQLAAETGKHVVLVLDQFERIVKELGKSESGGALLAELVRRLGCGAAEQVTVIYVPIREPEYFQLIVEAGIVPQRIEIRPMTPEEAMAVVERQIVKAQLHFEPETLSALRERFGTGAGGKFTLAHLQTICHLLARRCCGAQGSYEDWIPNDLEVSIDLAIREFDVMNFVGDFAMPRERMLVRSIIKASDRSCQLIAKHIHDSFPELLAEPQYPELF